MIIWLIMLLAGALGFYAISSDATKAKVRTTLIDGVSEIIGIATPALAQAETLLEPMAAAFATAFTTYGPQIRATIEAPVAALAKTTLELSADNLTSLGESFPENALERASEALAAAMGFGVASAGVTAAFEAAFPEKLNVLNGAGPMLAQMAGFAEVSAAIRDPLYRAAFGRAAEYHFNGIFKPNLPDEADAVTWHGRRLITDDQLRAIFAVSGLKSEFETPYIASAYRPVSPRAIATAYVDVNFPRDRVRAMMEFAGNRDQDIELMLDALESRSIQNVRAQYLTALMRSAELGTLTDTDLVAALHDLDFSDQAIHFVRLTVATRKLEQLTELYRKSVSEAYANGTILDADYVTNLEAIGIAPADAQAHYAIDSIKKQGRAIRAAEREAAALVKERERAAMQAAITSYRAGTLDELALSAALLAAGVDPEIAAFAVARESERRLGSEIFVYGLILPRAQAVKLREIVTAIEDQFKKQLIDDSTAAAALANNNIPDANARALLAAWAALKSRPTKTGELLPR